MKRILFLLSILILSADAGLACVCLPVKSAAEELERATAVFSGEVVQIKKHKERGGPFLKVEAIFAVEKVWKGITEKNVSVFTSATSLDCGYRFKKGSTYLVYAYAYGQMGLSTSICSRTKRLEDSLNDLEELGSGKAIQRRSRSMLTSVSRVKARVTKCAS